MISINNLCVTLSSGDCPNLHYKFDFSGFFNQHFAKDCVRFFKIKYENGVSTAYLSVLSTAFFRYDDFLRKNDISGSVYYNESEKNQYFDYLNSLYRNDERAYSKKYIHFLTFVPGHLSLTIKEVQNYDA